MKINAPAVFVNNKLSYEKNSDFHIFLYLLSCPIHNGFCSKQKKLCIKCGHIQSSYGYAKRRRKCLAQLKGNGKRAVPFSRFRYLWNPGRGYKHQLGDILQLGNYAYVGAGRDDGKDAGEHSAIFYKKDCFDVVENGDLPVFCTGDFFNATPDDEPIQIICNDGKMKDSYILYVLYIQKKYELNPRLNRDPRLSASIMGHEDIFYRETD